MKMGFLFGEEIADQFKKDGGLQEADLPEYFAWKYGPFSTTFLNDLEFLINQEYVRPQMSSGTPLIAELAEYEYWIDDLINCQVVTESGEVLGQITDVLTPGANDVYVVRKPGRKDILIPAIPQCIGGQQFRSAPDFGLRLAGQQWGDEIFFAR
jgi:hypothetical protein